MKQTTINLISVTAAAISALLSILNAVFTQNQGQETIMLSATVVYLRKLKPLYAAADRSDLTKFRAMLALFHRYARQYGIDELTWIGFVDVR